MPDNSEVITLHITADIMRYTQMFVYRFNDKTCNLNLSKSLAFPDSDMYQLGLKESETLRDFLSDFIETHVAENKDQPV